MQTAKHLAVLSVEWQEHVCKQRSAEGSHLLEGEASFVCAQCAMPMALSCQASLQDTDACSFELKSSCFFSAAPALQMWLNKLRPDGGLSKKPVSQTSSKTLCVGLFFWCLQLFSLGSYWLSCRHRGEGRSGNGCAECHENGDCSGCTL